MDKLESFLLGRDNISENTLPYYLDWIEHYINFCETEETKYSSDSNQIVYYLNSLSRKYKSWQVLQAKRAVSFFYDFKKSKSIADPAVKIEVLKEKKSNEQILAVYRDWKLIEMEAVRLMRLRHMSYRTEKTYLVWIRRFSTFLEI